MQRSIVNCPARPLAEIKYAGRSFRGAAQLKLVLVMSLLTLLSGCSFIERNLPDLDSVWTSDATPSTRPVPSPRKQQIIDKRKKDSVTRVAIEKLPDQKLPKDAVEVIWAAPEQPVDGYVLHYGNSPDLLDSEVTLSIGEIERYQHPDHGAVLRHVINQVPEEGPLYISISAYRGSYVSERSDTMKVKD